MKADALKGSIEKFAASGDANGLKALITSGKLLKSGGLDSQKVW